MSNKEVVNMVLYDHIKQEIAIKQLKIKSIHKDIIKLKQENRNIGDKVRSFHKHLKHNSTYLKCLAIVSFEEDSYVYKDRIKRDLTTIEYLRKLQEYNSRLINKHRSKVKSLRSELQELKKELNDTKGEK